MAMTAGKLCPCDKKMTLPDGVSNDCPYCGKPLVLDKGEAKSVYGAFGSKRNFIIFLIVDAVFTLVILAIILYFNVFKS